MKMTSKGFTLIELLIVVAIIAILAAIAVPNFLEAQVRAKVTRTVSDMRTVGIGIRVYAVDNNAPPYFDWPPWFVLAVPGQDSRPRGGEVWKVHYGLTTPIAYLTSVPVDEFNSQGWHYWNHEYQPMSVITTTRGPHMKEPGNPFAWWLESIGPDLLFWNQEPGWQVREERYEYYYNPTNGTVSSGQIWYHGDGTGDLPTITTEI